MGILLSNYENKVKNLTVSELAVFSELDNKPELLFATNLTELSSSLYSSNSTIIRLSQKLGFSGFSEFRDTIKVLFNTNKSSNSHNLIENYRFFFDTILPTIPSDKLDYFAEQIYHSKNIFIIGTGLTKPIAEYTAKHLYQLDRASIYIYENHMLDLLPNLAKHGDMILFISESGETKSLISCAKKVAQTGATLLSITNSSHNSLNYITNMALTTQMPENHYHNYDVTSRVFQLALIDLILDIYLVKYLS